MAQPQVSSAKEIPTAREDPQVRGQTKIKVETVVVGVSPEKERVTVSKGS